jgi:hypothetical protein
VRQARHGKTGMRYAKPNCLLGHDSRGGIYGLALGFCHCHRASYIRPMSGYKMMNISHERQR